MLFRSTGDVTLGQNTGKDQKVIVEAGQKVTVNSNKNLGVFTGEGTVVANKNSGDIKVIDTNVEVAGITGTVKVEGTTKITVTETPADGGKIEIAAGAVVEIEATNGAKIEVSDLEIEEGAKVTIKGDLVKVDGGKTRAAASTGLTIPAKTEVVVNGTVGEGVEITIDRKSVV